MPLYIDHEALEYELTVKNVNDTLVPTVKVRSYVDDDLVIGGEFTLRNRVVPLKHNGHTVPVAADLIFTNDPMDEALINVEIKINDSEDMMDKLRQSM